MIYEYTSIYEDTHSDFNRQLKNYTEKGWEPVGGISVSFQYNPSGRDHQRIAVLLRRTQKPSNQKEA